MKKKIITLALAVVMCLSVITSVTAADTLVRVLSTIPGTDIEYNYVEIPNTDYNTSVAAAFMAMTFSGVAMVDLKKKNK